MKKYTFMIFLALIILKIQSQSYLISFEGTGATTEIDTIKVDNLTSEATVTLNGGDILHLTSTVGIASMDIANGTLHIYPNPMTSQAILTFIAPESVNAVLSIVDLSGKTVSQLSTLLSRGTNSFRVSGINHGMYFVKVTGENYTCSTKLISQSNLQGQAVIEYVSSVNNTPGGSLKSVAATVDMPYTNGDQLLFKGISGIYRTIVPDVPASSKTITFNFAACTDNDGNNYPIVEIGAQTWMVENLNLGTRINGSVSQTNNGIIEKYCYDDNDSNCEVYGGLYQWDEAMQFSTTPGVQGICPTGWHLPTDAEWRTLILLLDPNAQEIFGIESYSAGGMMKETGTTHWLYPNTGATNSSGFTALPGGIRSYDGSFNSLTETGGFWSSTFYPGVHAFCRGLHNNDESVSRGPNIWEFGSSVRCVKD
jgi:uncharacterized protein (TIGR02145 family)